MDFWDCFGIFVTLTGFKILLSLRVGLYHSTDFDVHRNWLAITYSKPISEWYFEKTSEWTLDYPPFFAYFEWALAQFASQVDPLLVKIQKEAISTDLVVIFQKWTVIATDVFVLFGTYFYARALESKPAPLHVIFLVMCNSGLFLVDHLHFQYNGIILGILLSFLASFISGRLYLAAFLFSSLLHFKHIFLYVAPFVGVVFLQKINQFRRENGMLFSLRKLLWIGSIVVGVSIVSLGPFLGQLDQLGKRLFPFKRGLTHSYWAGNFWALYNLVDWAGSRFLLGKKSSLTMGHSSNFTHQFLPSISPGVTFVFTLVSMLPALWKVWQLPTKRNLILSYTSVALSSFIFGWHVHEKAILLALMPATGLLVLDTGFFSIYLILLSAGVSGLLPLIYTNFEQLIVLPGYWLFLFSSMLFYKSSYRQMPVHERVYVIASILITAFVQVWSKLLLPSLPFLPLLVQSSFTACGVLYSYILINLQLYPVESKKSD